MEFRGQVLVAGTVDLVDDDECRALAPAQLRRDLGVAGANPGGRVDDEEDHIGLGDPEPGLAADVLGELALVGDVDPAGVEQVEGDAVPLAGDALAVSGDAGLAMGDGLAAAGEAVDQGALADVGEADDGDGRHASRSR